MWKYVYSFVSDDYEGKSEATRLAAARALVAGKLIQFESVVTAVKITGNETKTDSFSGEEEVLPSGPFFVLDFCNVVRHDAYGFGGSIYCVIICLYEGSKFCILSEMTKYRLLTEEAR